MAFTRRHYVTLSDLIRLSDTDLFSHTELTRFATRLADLLTIDNPAFDRARFLTACGFAPASSSPRSGKAHPAHSSKD